MKQELFIGKLATVLPMEYTLNVNALGEITIFGKNIEEEADILVIRGLLKTTVVFTNYGGQICQTVWSAPRIFDSWCFKMALKKVPEQLRDK